MKMKNIVFSLILILLLSTIFYIKEPELSNKIDTIEIESSNITTTNKALTQEEVKNLVESNDSFNQRPILTQEELIEINNEIKKGLKSDLYDIDYKSLEDTIVKCLGPLNRVVADNRYLELVDKSNGRWDAYIDNDMYGINIYMDGILTYITYEPLIDDIMLVRELINYGLENRDVLAIIDAKRILQDLYRFLVYVQYYVSEDNLSNAERGEYIIGIASDGCNVISTLDKRYNGVTKTLKDDKNLLTDVSKIIDNK